MKSRILIGALFVLAVMAVAAVAAVEPTVAPRLRHQGIAFFLRPTQIAGKVVLGRVLIVHDDERMARGEACTTVYRYGGGRREELLSFMCKPEARPAIDRLTVRCVRNNANLMMDVMTEYQFPGETEAHGVPTAWYR